MTLVRRLEAELVLDARCELGECPRWDEAQQVLHWVDIGAGEVHRFDPATGEHTSIAVGQPVSALALRTGGGMVLAVRDGFADLDAAGRMTLLAPVEPADIGSRMNDGACDPRGRFWAGTMASDLAPGRGTLYCLAGDGSLQVRAELRGVTLSNGLTWTPDGRTMYYVDSATQQVDLIDFDLDAGRLGRRRPAFAVPVDVGMPDGIALDRDGCLWVALCGGGTVRRFRPDGAVDVVVEVAATRVTSCAFGGAGLDVLYITTASDELEPDVLAAQPHAGGLFAVRPGVAGHPAHRFTG